MKKIYNILNSIIEAIAKRMGVSLLYRTSVGIKPINQIISSSNFSIINKDKLFYIQANNLLLPTDGLKDKYTLLGQKIENSPHLDLMKCIENEMKIKNTSYIKRMQKGTLDFRRPIKLTKKNETRIIKTYYTKKKLIESNKYEPIKVVRVNNKYYIYDGKHTAALCNLLNIEVACVDITPFIYDSYYKWIYKTIITKEKEYKKHVEFFHDIWGR